MPDREQTAAAVAPHDPDLTRLLSAVYAGDTAVVTELLGRRPELARAHGTEGQTALHVAAYCNDPRLGVFLLSCGADPHAKYGQSGHTPLSWAVTCNAIEFAKTLVRLGIKPDLFCAAGIGALEDVQAFCDSDGTLRPNAASTGSSRMGPDGTRLPCPPPTGTEQVSDALYIASRNAQVEVVRFLLTMHPDLKFRAFMGATALHWAHFGGSQAIVELLEQAGADPGAREDTLHCTPRAFGICAPANWGFLELVRERLAEDPALATLYDEATTPLHEAAKSGNCDVVRLLLDAGANRSLRNAAGQTSPEIATECGHAKIVEMLG